MIGQKGCKTCRLYLLHNLIERFFNHSKNNCQPLLSILGYP